MFIVWVSAGNGSAPLVHAYIISYLLFAVEYSY